jgi:hypothetical protein
MEDITNTYADDGGLEEEQLVQYLMGKAEGGDISPGEKQLAEDAFAADAAEGLKNFSSAGKLDAYVRQLNKKLQQQLEEKKQGKEKREIKHLGWIIFSVVLILVLCVLGYVVVHMAEGH